MATIRKLRGRWQAQVRRRGMAPRAKSFDAKADAERWARQLETEIDRSGLMQDTRLAETTTLSSVLERYLIEVTPRKRSAKSETSRLRSICRLPIAHRTLATLTSADIAAYRDQRLEEVSPASVIREVNNLSHAIDYAIRDWGIYLPSNPCKLVRRPSPPKGRMRRLRAGEEQRLLDGTKNGGRNLYLHDIIILAIETGMRRSELLGLDWRHIDLTTG